MAVKTLDEIAIMREVGRIVAECHALLAELVRPGAVPLDLDAAVEAHIRKRGALPSFKGHHGFPASICVAPNDVICHGIPGRAPLQEGDVISIDVGAYYNGFHGDSAWTYAVGNVRAEIATLMEVTREAMYRGIDQARVGNRTGHIGHAIQALAEEYGYGVVREFTGHGIGRQLWESPTVPHFGTPEKGALLQAGMTLAIEPMITLGHWKAKVDPDGWTARTIDGSICVQYEHTVLVTDEGPEVLTTL